VLEVVEERSGVQKRDGRDAEWHRLILSER
jgi:cell division protein FtsL